MSTKGYKLLDSVKYPILKQREKTKNWYMDLQMALSRTLKIIAYGRTGITFILVAWLITVSIWIMKKNDTNDKEHQRYFNLHRVWFGEESIILILWKMWYYTLLLISLSPLIRELVTFIKLRLAI